MKISICIPTYNQAEYLVKSVRSAAQQSLRPFEIIVSDDCSTDNTPNVLQTLSKEISELRFVRQPKNLGIAGNTDSCLRLATGDFVVRLDSDDYLSPNYCEKLSELLLDYPEAGYAHAAVQEIDQHGKFLRQRWLARPSGFQSSEDGLRAASKGYQVAANLIMFRRKALVKVNYISDRPDYVEDFHLSASLSAAGFGNVYLNETLSFYRVWIDSGKVRQKRKMMEISGVKRVFNEVLEPEYSKRDWSLRRLKKSKEAIACRNCDCLGWEVYNKEEKEALKQAIFALSSSTKVKVFSWLYLNGHERGINLKNKITGSFKLFVKKRLYPSKPFKIQI